MKIICLDFNKRQITGGHKYNDSFIDYLSKIEETVIVRTPSCSSLYPSWLKPLAPIMELKRLKQFSPESIVFWGDTSYKYHFLLILITKLFLQVKSVIIVHHFIQNIESRHTFSSFLYYHYLKLQDLIIVPSPYTLSVAKGAFPQKGIFYIPLPFTKEYSPSADYEEGNFLYVGTIEPRKGLIYLIEALGIIKHQEPNKQFTLNIVGEIVDQHYAEQIIRKAEELNISDSIVLKGRVSDEELLDCYQRAEIFTFPSLLEGYGIVLIEAFSRGVPVVCFDNSAMPYTVKDGVNGLIAENKNAQSFADKILLLSGNRTLRDRFQKGIAKTLQGIADREDFEAGIRNFIQKIRIGE